MRFLFVFCAALIAMAATMPTAHAFSGAAAGVTSSATAKSPVELVQARKKGRRGARRGKRRSRGKNIGKGIAAGAAAAILLGIASEAARANDDYDDDRGYCRRLAYKCDDGRDWACRKFDRNCD